MSFATSPQDLQDKLNGPEMGIPSACVLYFACLCNGIMASTRGTPFMPLPWGIAVYNNILASYIHRHTTLLPQGKNIKIMLWRSLLQCVKPSMPNAAHLQTWHESSNAQLASQAQLYGLFLGIKAIEDLL
eukprot:3086716-Amphidinium_carterae.2